MCQLQATGPQEVPQDGDGGVRQADDPGELSLNAHDEVTLITAMNKDRTEQKA